MNAKKKKSPIDWPRVERIMLKGFRGQHITAEETALFKDAYKRAPKEYGIRNKKVRGDEVASIKKSGVI
jgi:hypothetical protein